MNLFQVENTNELKEHLTEDIDFAMFPEPAWQLLVQRYGLAPGQEPIARKVLFLDDTKITTIYFRLWIMEC